MAEQAAIGQDVIDLADALRLPRFAVAGYDWGGRAAAIAAAIHPDRVRATVLIGGYSIQNTVAPSAPGSPEARTPCMVPVGLQHRARTSRIAGQSRSVLSVSVEALVADVELHRRPTTRRRRHSTIRILSTSSFIRIDIATATRLARRASEISKRNWRNVRWSARHPSRFTAPMTAWRRLAGTPRRQPPSGRPLHRSWRGASYPALATSCRVSVPRRFRQRSSNS